MTGFKFISTHAPTEGSDPLFQPILRLVLYFNPRSHRRERRKKQQENNQKQYFNPRSHRRERHSTFGKIRIQLLISTHAPTEGSDDLPPHTQGHPTISTHAPTEGSDDERRISLPPKTPNFNPRSHRRERRIFIFLAPSLQYFNPRSHRRERLNRISDQVIAMQISTHAPTEGSDNTSHFIVIESPTFQPTLPPKGATLWYWYQSDPTLQFQPTLPPKGATTKDGLVYLPKLQISTHAPTEGSDDDDK